MLTTITRAMFEGKAAPTERDLTDNRRLAPRKSNRANNTKSPRTRDGQKFPGGKHLRRALAKLSLRKNAVVKDQKLPGSMKA